MVLLRSCSMVNDDFHCYDIVTTTKLTIIAVGITSREGNSFLILLRQISNGYEWILSHVFWRKIVNATTLKVKRAIEIIDCNRFSSVVMMRNAGM